MDVIITKKGEKNRYITLDSSFCLVCRSEDGKETTIIHDMTNEFDVYADDDGTLDVFGVNREGNLLHIRCSGENTTAYTMLENRSAKGTISSVRVFKIYGRYHLFYCLNHTERLLVHHIAGYGDYSMEPEVIDKIGEDNLFDVVCDEDKNIYVVYAGNDAVLKRTYTYAAKKFSPPQMVFEGGVRSMCALYFKNKLYVAFAAQDKGRYCVFLYDAHNGCGVEAGIKVHANTQVTLGVQSGLLYVQWIENSMCFATPCTAELNKERVKIFGRTKGLARLRVVGADVIATSVALNLSQKPFLDIEEMTIAHETPKFEYSGQQVDMLSRKYIEVLSRKNDFVDLDRELTRIESALERLVMLAETAIKEIKSSSKKEETEKIEEEQ